MTRQHHPALLPALTVLLILSTLASLAVGAVPLTPARMVATLTGHGDRIASIILFELRLPRRVLGLLVGAMLGLAGAVLQGFLRNPLAEPSVLGASNSAALGAVIALYFGLAGWSGVMLPLLAIVTGLGALLLLFTLAGRSDSPLGLVLAGIAVSTLA